MNVLQASRVRIALAIAAIGCCAASTALGQGYDVSELPTPAVGNSVAKGLNNAGSAAGRTGTTFATQTVAFVSRPGNRFQVIGTLPQGDYSSAFGVNDLDQVVGASNTATSVQAFIWEPKAGLQQIGALPGDNGSQAFAVNNKGDVVGYSSGPAGVRPFLWSRNGGMQYLGTLQGQFGMALAISDAGYVVGRSDSLLGPRAFLWSRNDDMLDLGTLTGHNESQAMGVNNNGTTVGYSSDGVHSQPVYWTRAGRIAPLGLLPGGEVGRTLAINNNGQMVGFSTATDHAYRAVVWESDGSVRDLNSMISPSAGVLLAEAQAINNRGQILVYGFRLPIDPDLHENPGRMYLLTPR